MQLFATRLIRPPVRMRATGLAGQAEATREAARPEGARRFRLQARLFILVTPFVFACQGDNMFSGDSTAIQPRASVFAPSLVVTGDEFQVQVLSEAARGISHIDVSIFEAFYKDTTVIISGSSFLKTATSVLRFRAPSAFLAQAMIVQARVTDRTGVSSTISADTAAAITR
ncbi:MAG: hypothetical protein ACRENP_12110 [Longimicrobiales bacterium]